MKNKWLFTCLMILLLAQTSCLTDETIMEEENFAVKTSHDMTKTQVQSLIQRARLGNTEAYKSLAVCYRDGTGVQQSYLNAMFMYNIYCQKVGKEGWSIIELYDVSHPYRLLIEILVSHSFDKNTEMKLLELKRKVPEEAKWIETLRTNLLDSKDINVLEQLKEAENAGSELAGVLQAFCFKETEDMEGYLRYLIRIAEKHPFLNLEIAKLYDDSYGENGDFLCAQKALEYYYKADSHGMLTPQSANHLLNMYDYFKWKGMLEYNEEEMERIKKIAHIETKKELTKYGK